jgi:hypothetical protein
MRIGPIGISILFSHALEVVDNKLQFASYVTLKHLFVGSENRSALITQFQLFATAGSDGFLGTIQRGGRPTTTPISVIAILQQQPF